MYNGIMLKMSFIDTPGYGANLDVTEWYKIVKGYIIKQVSSLRNNSNWFLV
jgi:Septin family protein